MSYSYDSYGRLNGVTAGTKKGEVNKTTYEYDRMNRLTRVVGRNGEATVYTYDASGVRRSKTTGDITVIFISDTAGELSHTLAETDIEGNATAVYTRGDTLISQTRYEKICFRGGS